MHCALSLGWPSLPPLRCTKWHSQDTYRLKPIMSLAARTIRPYRGNLFSANRVASSPSNPTSSITLGNQASISLHAVARIIYSQAYAHRHVCQNVLDGFKAAVAPPTAYAAERRRATRLQPANALMDIIEQPVHLPPTTVLMHHGAIERQPTWVARRQDAPL